MRWALIAILAYLAMVVETIVFRSGPLAFHVEGQLIRPDLLLILGVFAALAFEPFEVLVMGWGLGLMADLGARSGWMGVRPLMFAVLLFAGSYLQGAIFRTRVVTQFALTFIAVFTIHWAGSLLGNYHTDLPLAVGSAAELAIFDAIYTAVLAPYVFWLLFLLREPLKLPPGTTLD